MNEVTPDLTIRAPAKLNLSLQITGRRLDGYHQLLMLNVPISLEDEIAIAILPQSGVRAGAIEINSATMLPAVDTTHRELTLDLKNPDRNLALRAAAKFINHFKLEQGIEISIRKKIPAGAGLGGGSSDGAAVLRGLTRLFSVELAKRGFSQSVIQDSVSNIALSLGADLPYFLNPQASIVSGVGDELTALSSAISSLLHKHAVALVLPEIPMPTQNVYSKFRELNLEFSDASKESLRANLSALEPSDLSTLLVRNDLEPAIRALEPKLAALLDELRDIPHAHVSFSGSGSAIFVLPHSRSLSFIVNEQLNQVVRQSPLRACVIHCSVITSSFGE